MALLEASCAAPNQRVPQKAGRRPAGPRGGSGVTATERKHLAERAAQLMATLEVATAAGEIPCRPRLCDRQNRLVRRFET